MKICIYELFVTFSRLHLASKNISHTLIVRFKTLRQFTSKPTVQVGEKLKNFLKFTVQALSLCLLFVLLCFFLSSVSYLICVRTRILIFRTFVFCFQHHLLQLFFPKHSFVPHQFLCSYADVSSSVDFPKW